MSDRTELEERLAAALGRIRDGVARLSAAEARAEETLAATPSAAQAAEIAHLQAALDAERAARAAADAALDALRSPEPDHVAQAEIARLTRQLDEQGLDNQRLRSSVAQLREEVRRLREAAEGAVPDAALVNRALQAELESLRAVRASETTEMADIIAALTPLIEAEEGRAHA